MLLFTLLYNIYYKIRIILLSLLLVPKFEGKCKSPLSGRKSRSGMFETYTDEVMLQWRCNVLTCTVGRV